MQVFIIGTPLETARVLDNKRLNKQIIECGQILDATAKDCWKCSSKEIEQVVEEETKELKKVMLQARIDKLEHEVKSIKKSNDILFLLFFVAVIAIVIMIFTNR